MQYKNHVTAADVVSWPWLVDLIGIIWIVINTDCSHKFTSNMKVSTWLIMSVSLMAAPFRAASNSKSRKARLFPKQGTLNNFPTILVQI